MKKPNMLRVLLLILCLFAAPSLCENEGDFAYSIHDGQAAITAYTGTAADLTLPGILGGYPVTTIRYCAFRSCTSLTRVVIPEGIVSVGSNAFSGCVSLEQIILPQSVTALGSHAFYGCPNLKEITLHDSLAHLHPYAFYGCSAARLCALGSQAAAVLTDYGYAFTSPDHPQLALMAFDTDGLRTLTVADCDESAFSVSIPTGVTVIDDYAFFGCGALKELVLPEGVVQIGHSAFEGCDALERIILPASIKTISPSAFSDCSAVTIVSPPGSAGQRFAQAHGFLWQAP